MKTICRYTLQYADELRVGQQEGKKGEKSWSENLIQ